MKNKIKATIGNIYFFLALIFLMYVLFYQPIGYYSFYLFFIWLLLIVFGCWYSIGARTAKLPFSELIDKKIINLSNLEEIYISAFGGRLTFKKNSYPLQRNTDNYRKIFNGFTNTIVDEIDFPIVKEGKVDQIIDKSKDSKSTYIMLQILFGVIAFCVIAFDISFLIKAILVFLCIIISIFDKRGSWKLTDSFKYKSFFKTIAVDLEKIKGLYLRIPDEKLYFELEISTDLSTLIIRDKMLKEILPIISAVNNNKTTDMSTKKNTTSHLKKRILVPDRGGGEI